MKQDMEQGIEVLTDLGPLEGLPGNARFTPVLGKQPITKRWNEDPSTWLTQEQVIKERNLNDRCTGIGLLTGRKTGNLVWLDFDGESEDEETGEIKSAALDFEWFTGMPLSRLPKSPICLSGKPTRFRALFRMPEYVGEEFKGISVVGKCTPTHAFEILYEKEGGKCFHAVIEGPHPDNPNWLYHWKKGYSPSDIPIPDLPFKVINGISRHITRTKLELLKQDEERGEVNKDKPRTMDLLDPGKQRKLVKEMMEYWPYRWEPGGNYHEIAGILLSLWRGINDPQTFKLWIIGSSWDKKNDWTGERGAQRVPGGDPLKWIQSLLKSKTEGKKIGPWGCAFDSAIKGGWQVPEWCLPPREIGDPQDLLKQTAITTTKLGETLKKIDEADVSSTQRLLAMQGLRKDLGINKAELAEVITALQEELHDNSGSTSFEDVMKSTVVTEPLVERLIPVGCVCLLAAEGGTGKTSMMYRLSEAVSSGKPFAGAFKVPKAQPVLMVQKDESQVNALVKWRRMELKPGKGMFHVRWNFHVGMLPELRKWIIESKAKLVLLDSLGTLLGGGGASLNDAEIGLLYMYHLNKIASDLGVSIVITHHLKKENGVGRDGQPRARVVTKNSLYGSAYLVNGASQCWGLYKEARPEFGAENDDSTTLILKVLKDRSGITEDGDKFELRGNADDYSFELIKHNESEQPIEELDTLKQKLHKVLGKYKSPETAITKELLHASEGISKYSNKAMVKELRALVDRREVTGVVRIPIKGKGQSKYAYYRIK
tara:strand:- start:6411 stop:8717 length:2307 start_codon:yes stop_codon:yes gene_type:complete